MMHNVYLVHFLAICILNWVMYLCTIQIIHSYSQKYCYLRGGARPKKTKKNQSLHQNWQIGIGFFWFFKISKLALVFFCFFWFFLVFFGIGFGQNSKLETGFFWFFLGFFGFFWFFLA